jgi:hypothetical protein
MSRYLGKGGYLARAQQFEFDADLYGAGSAGFGGRDWGAGINLILLALCIGSENKTFTLFRSTNSSATSRVVSL